MVQEGVGLCLRYSSCTDQVHTRSAVVEGKPRPPIAVPGP